jgi:hypothetical protein
LEKGIESGSPKDYESYLQNTTSKKSAGDEKGDTGGKMGHATERTSSTSEIKITVDGNTQLFMKSDGSEFVNSQQYDALKRHMENDVKKGTMTKDEFIQWLKDIDSKESVDSVMKKTGITDKFFKGAGDKK